MSALAHIEVQEAMADHFAKDQEAKKNNGGEESKDDDEEEEEASKTEGDGGAKPDDTTNDVKSNTSGLAKAAKPEKSSSKDTAGVHTAVSVEPSVKNETPKADSEADKTESEAKEPEEGDDDDEMFFEMDEDTFHFYKQAEQEAENKATEAQSKAMSSFCSIIFQTIIVSLFVVKLNQVYQEREEVVEDIDDGTSSFSTFWILFPFFLISGCVICCFACAIFGAASIDTAMASEEASGNGDDDDDDEEASGADNEASPVILTPPPPQGDEGPARKKDETSVEVSNTVAENTGNASSPAEVADTDQESAMDDLD